jgi:chromosome segregation ATPase
MARFKTHLKNAQTAYTKYDTEYRKKINEDAMLLQSLQRQRVFIREERKYIDHMEREALSLKKYSKQYIVIQREVREMRVQVNKEIQDVERAYRIAKSKIIAERNVAKSRRSSESSKTTSYQSMVTRYETLTRTYTGLLTKLGAQQSGNLRLKKELQDQLDLLQEIRVILATFKAGSNTDDKYQQKYEKCVEDFRTFRNKYQNMNCTAI